MRSITTNYRDMTRADDEMIVYVTSYVMAASGHVDVTSYVMAAE